jgi:hypothetical protein
VAVAILSLAFRAIAIRALAIRALFVGDVVVLEHGLQVDALVLNSDAVLLSAGVALGDGRDNRGGRLVDAFAIAIRGLAFRGLAFRALVFAVAIRGLANDADRDQMIIDLRQDGVSLAVFFKKVPELDAGFEELFHCMVLVAT